MRPDTWPALTASSTGPTVDATTTLVLAANQKRVDATFVNDSDEVIYLARGSDAVLHTGIRLNAAGGSYEINDSNRFLGAVNAICESGSKVLCVSEGRKK